ncbi:MAG: cystathionine beta-lyase [Oxalobacter sp.]|nr:MAG: cystathionine beta-lyase [Oxalobacter sp.]
MDNKKKLGTLLNHSDYKPLEGFEAFPTPIHHASTVLFKNVAAMRTSTWQDKSAYTYGLHGTPTTFTLEARVAEIENGKHCILAPSGLAAITIVNFGLLRTGDDMLIPDNVYGPNRDMGNWIARDFGITVRFYDPMIGAGIGDLIQANTKLVWAETPGSLTMEVPDILAICKAAHEKGAIVVLDNTWGAGIYFNSFEHGADISLQALTKYQSGGSDVLMGALITNNDDLYYRLSTAHGRLGMGVGPDDVYLVLRGMQSLKTRMEAHDVAARKIAAWLKARPEISKVLHPAFSDCPGHDVWKRDFTGASGLFSVLFDPRYTEAQTDRFVDSLRYFKIGYSWGGSHSLCVPYRIKTMHQFWKGEGELVRFHIGLEDTQDLIADLEQALTKL